METNRAYLTTKETAAELNLSIHTIYKYIREGILHPVYEENWQIDQTHLFKLEDIESLKMELEKPGLTTSEVAEKLGIHPTTIISYINQGVLKATKQHYRGRDIYFINEDNLQSFKVKHNVYKGKNAKSFYSRNKNLYLYQTLININTNEMGRIIELDEDEGTILLEDGQAFPITQMMKKGFFPKEQFVDHKHIAKPGYAKLKFQKPNHVSSPVFNIIETFYREIGYKNIKLSISEDYIYIDVKPYFIGSNMNSFEINLLKDSIYEGNVVTRHNGILIESDIELVTIQLPSQLKKQIQTKSKQKGLTISEYVTDILNEAINREDVYNESEIFEDEPIGKELW